MNADVDGDIVHSEKLKVKDYTTGFDTCRHTFKNTSSCVTYKCNAGGDPETGSDGSLAGAAGFIAPKSTRHSSERCGASWVCTPVDNLDSHGNVIQPKNCKEDKKTDAKDVYYLQMYIDGTTYSNIFRTFEMCERSSVAGKEKCEPISPEGPFPFPTAAEAIKGMIKRLQQQPNLGYTD